METRFNGIRVESRCSTSLMLKYPAGGGNDRRWTEVRVLSTTGRSGPVRSVLVGGDATGSVLKVNGAGESWQNTCARSAAGRRTRHRGASRSRKRHSIASRRRRTADGPEQHGHAAVDGVENEGYWVLLGHVEQPTHRFAWWPNGGANSRQRSTDLQPGTLLLAGEDGGGNVLANNGDVVELHGRPAAPHRGNRRHRAGPHLTVACAPSTLSGAAAGTLGLLWLIRRRSGPGRRRGRTFGTFAPWSPSASRPCHLQTSFDGGPIAWGRQMRRLSRIPGAACGAGSPPPAPVAGPVSRPVTMGTRSPFARGPLQGLPQAGERHAHPKRRASEWLSERTRIWWRSDQFARSLRLPRRPAQEERRNPPQVSGTTVTTTFVRLRVNAACGDPVMSWLRAAQIGSRRCAMTPRRVRRMPSPPRRLDLPRGPPGVRPDDPSIEYATRTPSGPSGPYR